ncbi:hypothetical protein B0H17DRAFT_1127137 [Mycena rosella]|uniref:Uncharacterized protein n=1 Tax=Mycena rosella TaxID=1033263 RepID=A0AAD7GNQ0_MYCRO|nr:hypothetical protein B0H17DRAFT_1127137 [Mycena rosella]
MHLTNCLAYIPDLWFHTKFTESTQFKTVIKVWAKEARESRLRMVICDRTFELVEEYLAALTYDGPVGLTCDDTKLFSGLRMYYDAKNKADYLIRSDEGSPGRHERRQRNQGSRLVSNHSSSRRHTPRCCSDAYRERHDRGLTASSYRKDPIRLALAAYSCYLLCLRWNGIERSVQRKLVETEQKIIKYTVTSPIPGAPDLELAITTFFDYPVTFSNNLFTGARVLTFGNYTAISRRIYEMAMVPGSPLFRRDVERLEREDDAAATRLFCATVLEYLSEKHPEYIGEIVYLFSREIIKLALRAQYFVDAWENYLDAIGYKYGHCFLSREAVDIARNTSLSFLGIIRVNPASTNSATRNSRDIVKDFTFLDSIFMIPKLRVTMHEAILSGKTSHANTYFEALGADLAALAIYPSNEEIQMAARPAAAESDSLVTLLGIAYPITPKPRPHAPVLSTLPTIGAWFNGDASESEAEDGTESDPESEEEFDNDNVHTNAISEAEELQVIIDMYEHANAPLLSARVDRKIMSLTCASIAITADEQMRM